MSATEPLMVDPATRAEVAELVARAAEWLDAGDFAGVGALFADAVVRGSDGVVRARGASEIAGLFASTTMVDGSGSPLTAHVVTNTIVDPLGDDEVEARSRFTVFQATSSLALQPIVLGRYVDRFVRDQGRWRFSERRIEGAAWGDVSRHIVPGVRGRAPRTSETVLPDDSA